MTVLAFFRLVNLFADGWIQPCVCVPAGLLQSSFTFDTSSERLKEEDTESDHTHKLQNSQLKYTLWRLYTNNRV